MTRKILVTFFVVMIIALLVALPLVALNVLENQLKILDGFSGYMVVAVIGLVTNATIVFPTPTMMPVVVEIANQNNLIAVAGVYAFFAAFGEMTGYLLGMLGNKISKVEHSRSHQKLEKWMQGRRTGIVLFFLAATPSPFDIGGMIAGNARYPIQWFLLATFLGRWLKYMWLIPLWGVIARRLEYIPWIGNASGVLMVFGLLIFIGIMERKILLQQLSYRLRRQPQPA